MLRINDIKLELGEDLSALRKKVIKKTGVSEVELKHYSIVRESIDARKSNVIRVYTLDAAFENEAKVMKRHPEIKAAPDSRYKLPPPGAVALENRPVVIGFGPAGMFAGLMLAEQGYQPIIVERGSPVDQRTLDIEQFWKERILNTESNVQFGEGGAGTFSDGKLTSRSKDVRSFKVLEELVRHGAPEEIAYKNKPHVGTDLLKEVVVNIRKTILEKGGQILFNTRVDEFILSETDLQVQALKLSTGEFLPCGPVVLAIGHSARDTFEMLHQKGVTMTQKPFAVGVRIEHQQKAVNQCQYKNTAISEALGAAEYFLTYQASNGRSAYTFCMCPGGEVVAAASEKESVVTNGMSYHARSGNNANSALLVNVSTSDFEDDHPLAGVAFQRKLERNAYLAGGSNYNAPAQTVGDFLQDGKSSPYSNSDEAISATYRPGLTYTDLSKCLPDFIVETLKEALPALDRKMNGFGAPHAIMTAVESRTSSPVRIVRNDETLESISLQNMYPCGEGAGYAGGIVSSAIDGLRVAEKIIEKYCPRSEGEIK